MTQEISNAYSGVRLDVAALVPADARTILDVGSSTGSLGSYLKLRNAAQVWGVEIDPNAASQSMGRLDRVIVANAEDLDFSAFHQGFDCVVFADSLEHMRDPIDVLGRVRNILNDGGSIIISVPNVQHITVILNLLRGRWPARDRGIFDRTHLRFFTLHSLADIAGKLGMQIVAVRRNYRILDRPHQINVFASWMTFFLFKNFLAYQYILKLK